MTKEIDKKIGSCWHVGQEILTTSVHITSLLWCGAVGILMWGGKDVISGYFVIFVTCLFLVSVFFLIIIEPIAKKVQVNEGTLELKNDAIYIKYQAIKFSILRAWGKCFRAVFIAFVGIAGYYWIDPQPIGGTPFPDITLGQFFSNLCALFIALGCVVWFFRFPNKNHAWADDPKQNSYVLWGAFGMVVISLVVGITFLAYPVLMMVQEATK